MNILRRPGTNYRSKVLSLGPILYYPFNEKNGTVANNLGSLGSAANGTYYGASLANAAGPKGDICPYFDGITDYVDGFSVALRSSISRDYGTAAIWLRAPTAESWTDERAANLFYLQFINTGQVIKIEKMAGWLVRLWYNAGGGPSYLFDPATTDWIHLAHTWDSAANEWIPYVNGIAVAAPAAFTVVNDLLQVNTIASVHLGWAAHAAIWNRTLTPSEISLIGT